MGRVLNDYIEVRSIFDKVMLRTFGLLAMIGGMALLYHFETRVLSLSQLCDRILAEVVDIPDPAVINPALDGKIVHVFGDVSVSGELIDPQLGVRSAAVRLIRKTQYYQLVGGRKMWCDSPLTWELKGILKEPARLSNVHTQSSKAAKSLVIPESVNALVLPVAPAEWLAPEANLGAYRLSDYIKSNLPGPIPLNLAALGPREFQAIATRFPEPAKTEPGGLIHVIGNTLYFGPRPSTASVGDVAATFFENAPSRYSLVAKAFGGTLVALERADGGQFILARPGMVTASDMVADYLRDGGYQGWVNRALGAAVAALVGFLLCREWIAAGFGWIPIVGPAFTSGSAIFIGAIPLLIPFGLAHEPGSSVRFCSLGAATALAMLAMWYGRCAEERAQPIT